MSNATMSNVTILPGSEDYDKTGQFTLRTKTYTGKTVTDCLLQAKQELGADAIIVSRRTYKKGALFGRWGGRQVVEMTFGTYQSAFSPGGNPGLRYSGGERRVAERPQPGKPLAEKPAPEKLSDAESTRIQELEAKLATLTQSIQDLSEPPKAKRPSVSFIPAALQAGNREAASSLVMQEAPRERRRKDAPVSGSEESGYPGLMQQLLDADIAAPLARQLIGDVPAGLTAMDAATFLRTILSQRLRIANSFDAAPVHGKMRLMAFIGTTGVGKTTTIAKLTARFALMERRKVGVITFDTQRIGAAEQLQKYGEIFRVPVKVAHDKLQLVQFLEDFAAEGKEIVMLDTAGRSPNEMIPLGETAHLFDGVGSVQKYLTIPAVLGQRDMENIVTRFQSIFAPDAMILTKLDEASDHTCFGRLMTLQAKYGLPLAYITTGQRVPDDILLPDAHAISSRILAAPLM